MCTETTKVGSHHQETFVVCYGKVFSVIDFQIENKFNHGFCLINSKYPYGLVMLRRVDSVVVSVSSWNVGGPGAIPGHGSHVIFGVKHGSQHWELCSSRESKNHVNVLLSLGCKRTIEDNKLPRL